MTEPILIRFPWFTLYGLPDRPGALARLRCGAAMLVHEAVELVAGTGTAHAMSAAARFQIGAPSIVVPASQRNKLYVTTVADGFPTIGGDLVGNDRGVELRVYASGTVGDTYESIFNPGELVEVRLSNPVTGDWELVGGDARGQDSAATGLYAFSNFARMAEGTIHGQASTGTAIGDPITWNDGRTVSGGAADAFLETAEIVDGVLRHRGTLQSLAAAYTLPTATARTVTAGVVADTTDGPGDDGASYVRLGFIDGANSDGYLGYLIAPTSTANHQVRIIRDDSGVPSAQSDPVDLGRRLGPGDRWSFTHDGNTFAVLVNNSEVLRWVDSTHPASSFTATMIVLSSENVNESPVGANLPGIAWHALSTGSPITDGALSDATPDGLGTATAGVSGEASRSDHIHPMPDYTDVGADPAGAAQAVADTLGSAALANTGDFEAAGAVSAHTGDTTAAHAASAISVGTLNGNLSAVSGTDVEQALQAVDNLSLGGTVDVVSNVATNTILGRVTAGSGNSEELTAAQTRTLLGVAAATPVGASTWNSVQNYSLPGVMYDALNNAFALTANTIRYMPFRVPDGTTLAVDRIWFEVTTNVAASNARIGVWAADINWQPTGAPLIDATATTATNGAKNITVSATLSAGRYIAGIVSDANISCRAGIARVSWGSDHSGTAVAAGGSQQMISNRRVALTYPGTMPTPGPAWTSADAASSNGASDLLILLRGTFS
jgi:hypothetical protein